MELTNSQMLGVAVTGCVIAAVMGSFAGRVEATMADPNATVSMGGARRRNTQLWLPCPQETRSWV